MKVDALLDSDLAGVPSAIRALEAAGFDGALSAEVTSDPFLPLALAAEHSERIELRTSIAVAFARNPMLLANLGHDLQRYSGGRFTLGLGSQIRPHIERRYSMPWSRPAARMREMVLALRAIWDCWNDGTPLDFEGEFYSHTLMTPFFDPGPSGHGSPDVFIAAVGPLMTEVAGEVGAGLLVHGFATERSLREITLPALEKGLARAGRSRSDVQVVGPMFIVTGRTDDEVDKAAAATKEQIAFYASTPAYRGVLELHGWGELQSELRTLTKQDLWPEMGGLIDDEILHAFAVVAEPGDVAQGLLDRYGGLLDRISFYTPGFDARELPDATVRTLQNG